MSDNTTIPISMQDIVRLFENIQSQVARAVENSAAARESASAAREAASAAKESGALALRKVIDLEEAFSDFKRDSIYHRSMREGIEQEEALHQLEAAKKRLQAINPPITKDLSTQERIEKAITTQLKKDKIDWGDLWKNKIVPALAILTATTIWGALLWVLIVNVILPALNRIAGN